MSGKAALNILSTYGTPQVYSITNIIGVIVSVIIVILLIALMISGFTYSSTTEVYGPWTCVNDIQSPLRLNKEGNVQCMSTNERTCITGVCTSNLSKNASEIQPVTCSAADYNVSDSYCQQGFDVLLRRPGAESAAKRLQ